MQLAAQGRTVRLAADIGGTFTDIVLEAEGRRLTRKVLTTAGKPEGGVLDGAALVLADAGLTFADVDLFVHGTTLATNAVLERRGAKTALITTQGFRDVLEIGTEGRYDQYDLQLEKRPPLVPRVLRLPVPERMDAGGRCLLPLDDAALADTLGTLRRAAVESLAICFLHAYANNAHELRVREVVAAAFPSLAISISSEVCPEVREYERTSTTVVNAYVQPLMAGYLGRMRTVLAGYGFHGALYVVTSNGGLASLETAMAHPVRLIESGPAGGAIFAADVAVSAGERKVLAFDMGGTTAKICLIEDFRPEVHRVFEVDRAARFHKGSGLPLRIPVIDLVEIGAGGGSVAQVNSLGNVTVGPQSVGSEPGPACYGRGGTQASVTDADAVLGLLDPDGFADGCVRLDLDASRTALATHVARPLGISVEMAAYAVHELVCETMASAARVHAIEKGRAASDHTLLAFGGAAPLHAARVAEKIGAERVLIPRNAGVGSAVGFLRAPVSFDLVQSLHAYLDELDYRAVSDMLDRMEQEARTLVTTGAIEAPVSVRRLAYVRYVGQGHEIPVELPPHRLAEADRQVLQDAFEHAYAVLFARIVPGARQEVTSWSVLVSTASPGGTATAEGAPPGAATPPARRCRPFFDGRSATWLEVPVFERDGLAGGASIAGPALITERETTTFVSGTFQASIDRNGSIVLQRKRSEIRAA